MRTELLISVACWLGVFGFIAAVIADAISEFPPENYLTRLAVIRSLWRFTERRVFLHPGSEPL